MQVLTAEETLAAIEKATAPLLREITILKRVVKENGDMIDSNEAMRRTGIKSLVTLKKLFTPTPQGRWYYFSKVEIETYLAELELTKAPALNIQKPTSLKLAS
jgi:hypothetical protein